MLTDQLASKNPAGQNKDCTFNWGIQCKVQYKEAL